MAATVDAQSRLTRAERVRRVARAAQLAAAVTVLFLVATAILYNRLVSASEAVDASWAQVVNVMKRRAELIPNLVAVTASYARHEQVMLDSVTSARTAYLASRSLDAQLRNMRRVDALTPELLALGERYPSLAASRAYVQLRFELLGTENRIAVERSRYNESVRAYRTMRRTWPASVVAAAFAFPDPPSY